MDGIQKSHGRREKIHSRWNQQHVFLCVFLTTIHMSTRPEGFLNFGQNPVTPLL